MADPTKIDTIVIGAGFAGIVMAERLARINGENVLVIEQRGHIGGNCYDCYDEHDILIHQYGPHILHTDNQKVWEYLSQFTDWHYYQHRVLGSIDGKEVPIPFNLDTLYALVSNRLASRLEEKLISSFGFGNRLPLASLSQSDDPDLQFLSKLIFEKIFRNYTVKHWGIPPDEISSEVYERVPVVISRDDRYFHDRYQGVPRYGFTRMFEKMLDLSNIKILLNTSMQDVMDIDIDAAEVRFMGRRFAGKLIFTGMIDSLLDYRYGELPYRALTFKWENVNRPYYQNAAVVNFPNDYNFTRITEFKHMTGQVHHNTSILREYPCQFDRNDPDKNIPCYPIFTAENEKAVKNYMFELERFRNIWLIGRLAEYKYYDMDDLVERALELFEDNFNRE